MGLHSQGAGGVGGQRFHFYWYVHWMGTIHGFLGVGQFVASITFGGGKGPRELLSSYIRGDGHVRRTIEGNYDPNETVHDDRMGRRNEQGRL